MTLPLFEPRNPDFAQRVRASSTPFQCTTTSRASASRAGGRGKSHTDTCPGPGTSANGGRAWPRQTHWLRARAMACAEGFMVFSFLMAQASCADDACCKLFAWCPGSEICSGLSAKVPGRGGLVPADPAANAPAAPSVPGSLPAHQAVLAERPPEPLALSTGSRLHRAKRTQPMRRHADSSRTRRPALWPAFRTGSRSPTQPVAPTKASTLRVAS